MQRERHSAAAIDQSNIFLINIHGNNNANIFHATVKMIVKVPCSIFSMPTYCSLIHNCKPMILKWTQFSLMFRFQTQRTEMVFYRERENGTRERPPLSLILPHLYLGAETDVTQVIMFSFSRSVYRIDSLALVIGKSVVFPQCTENAPLPED